MRRARRTEWYYTVTCNGDDNDGCRWSLDAGKDERRAKSVARIHAENEHHEVVVVIENAMTVYDGRQR